MPDAAVIPLHAELPWFNLEEVCGTAEDWKRLGERLGGAERSVMWIIGEWWNLGERYGERVAIVTAADWRGPRYQTCRDAGWVAKRWNLSGRHDRLTFEHHRLVAKLPDEQARPLLAWCAETNEPRSTRDLLARVKQVRRDTREVELADHIDRVSTILGVQRYGVIYADPPWRFEPRSRISGMDRAADNHYPTMTADELHSLDIPAASDCVMFMWSTIAMLPDAMALLAYWRFGYRSAYGWLKPGPGTGYWSQSDQLELLLVGMRGDVPAPAPGTQPPQVQIFPRTRHSEKPPAFAAMIEAMFPNVPRLEMFCRSPRPGWDTWGAEAECAQSDR